ncbi:MAG: hypothetical protein JXB35_00920 [Anaerolineae bacterium]|nr:hypothetical protein [Anaerolineae bacterium]
MNDEFLTQFRERPDPEFAERLYQHLNRQRRWQMMKKRWLMAVAAALIMVVMALALWPQSLSTSQVLAQMVEATQTEPGQIVHQTYTSEDGILDSWQLMDVAPDGGLAPSVTMTIRYALEDTDLANPLEWSYTTPQRVCNLTASGIPTAGFPEADSQGCYSLVERQTSSTSEGPASESATQTDPNPRPDEDPNAPPPVEKVTPGESSTSFEEAAAVLPQDSENVIVEKLRLDEGDVYAITTGSASESTDTSATVKTVFIDSETYLPVGYEISAGDQVWRSAVLRYEVLDPDALGFDPFAWPPGVVNTPPAP